MARSPLPSSSGQSPAPKELMSRGTPLLQPDVAQERARDAAGRGGTPCPSGPPASPPHLFLSPGAVMLLVLSEEQKAHLGCLTRVGGAAVGELGHLAVELLRRGAAPKACEAAARKLNAGIDTVQHGVEGLMYLLTESSKLMISEMDFQDSIHVLGFPDELNKLLLQLYLDNRKEIRSILGELAPKLPSYHSLEWRLDVQLASRSLRQQINPAVTIKLHLNENEDLITQVLQTDPSTLLHLIQQLEQALGEMKTNHCKRIVRNMK